GAAAGQAAEYRAPGRRPLRRVRAGPRPPVAPPLRPRLPGGDRHDTGPLRRPGTPRTRPALAGGHRGRCRGGLARQRLRHARGHAARLPQSARHGPDRVPPPLPPRRGPLTATPGHRPTHRPPPRTTTRSTHPAPPSGTPLGHPPRAPPSGTAPSDTALDERSRMQIAVLLFDRFTALDAVGPYEILSRIPGAETVFVAERAGPVRDESGRFALTADRTLDEVPRPDVVVTPGGPGQSARMTDATLLDWLRTADATSTWTTSVCSGSLLLAAAGLLRGRRATSHWLALDQLTRFGAEPTGERVVTDGKYVTAAG